MGHRVLILFAHPALERSRVHRRLLEAPSSLSGITLRDLYELYPDLDIDVEAEQDALVHHDVIVFQHPLYWYSVPPILKQWQDLVLEHGWAYGREGRALAGKKVLHVLSSGGGQESYRPGGYNNYRLADFLRPLEQTARLCKMSWLPPYAIQGTHGISEETLGHHVDSYRHLLAALQEGPLDVDRVRSSDGLLDVDVLFRGAEVV